MDRTPGGAQTRSKQEGVFGLGPRYVQAAINQHVTVEGRDYVDWIAALAAVGLGYDWHTVGALTPYPLPTRREGEVAAELMEAVRFGDQVRWVTTGSEGTLAAMMLARRVTGRRKVVSLGYHGWHEAHLPGRDVVALPIGARSYAETVIDGGTAAVIIEVLRNEGRKNDARITAEVEMLHDAARRVGALVIHDEIVTGFRWAVGGAREYLGLGVPDLAVYGKAMSNGFPIAAVVGPRYLMSHAHGISSTYGGWPPALEAVSQTIRVYKEREVVEHMWTLGQRLLTQCPGVLAGYPVHPVFVATKDYTTSEAALPYVKKAAEAGHLVHPSGFNIMLAHSEQDVDELSAAFGGISPTSEASTPR